MRKIRCLVFLAALAAALLCGCGASHASSSANAGAPAVSEPEPAPPPPPPYTLDRSNIPEEAIHGKRIGTYGVEALVEREFMPRDAVVDRASLEDIILYMVKGEQK